MSELGIYLALRFVKFFNNYYYFFNFLSFYFLKTVLYIDNGVLFIPRAVFVNNCKVPPIGLTNKPTNPFPIPLTPPLTPPDFKPL